MTATRVFLLAFLCSLLIQAIMWRMTDFVDQQHWINATYYLHTGNSKLYDPFIYGYPGTAPMVIAVAVHRLFSVPIASAYIGSVSLLVALGAAGAATMAYLLKPASLWWVAVALIIAGNTLLFTATPPSLIVIPFLVWLHLCTLYVMQRTLPHQHWPLLLFGAIWGVALAARLDFSLAIGGLLLVMLIWQRGFIILPFVILGSAIAAFTFIPFLWTNALDFGYAFGQKLFYHYVAYEEGRRFSLPIFLADAAFALISVGLGLLYVRRRSSVATLPRWFLWFLLLETIVLVTLLLPAAYQASWYLSPLVILWEVFLPLFLIELSEVAPQRRSALIKTAAVTTVISVYCILMVVNLFLDAQYDYSLVAVR